MMTWLDAMEFHILAWFSPRLAIARAKVRRRYYNLLREDQERLREHLERETF